MNVKEWLEKVAYIEDYKDSNLESKVYKSKFDGSYITHVGMEKDNKLLKFLAEHDVVDELTHGVGFSPTEHKWYGWSHRAIYGFGIGSEVKKGDCAYVGDSLKAQEDAAIQFWSDESYINVKCTGIIEKDDNRYFNITWEYNDKCENKNLHGTIGSVEHYITPLGHGEWTAKTLSDAKQMAIDFNQGVS